MDKFAWGNIYSFFWIIAVIATIFIIIFGTKKRNSILKHFIDMELIPNIVIGHNNKRLIKNILIVVSLFFCVIALMEPKYDYTWETISKKGVDIFIALDASKSMLASDITPSRFERSKLEIKNLVNNLGGDRVGFILFTSKAITQCPLTIDYATLKLFVDEASIGLLQQGGTSLSAAIQKAVNSFDKQYKKERILIIVTDGESHDHELDKAIDKAKEAGIKIFTVGLGTKEGVPILLPSENGKKEYLKDSKGDIVLTKLDDDQLKKLALHTGGAYIQANSQGFSLEQIYKEKIEPLEGRELESKRKKKYENRFYIPLAFALLLLLAEVFMSEI